MMLGLQGRGALNINLVSPTHVILPVLRALRKVWARGGLSVPIVYNSNGYDNADVIARLEGIVDIYLPDLKYVSPRLSAEYSGAADYFECGLGRGPRDVRSTTRPGARREGHRPQGPRSCGTSSSPATPRTPSRSSAGSGTISLRIIGLSLMSQYHPCHEAPEELRRSLSREEYAGWPARPWSSASRTCSSSRSRSAVGEHRVPDFDEKIPSTGNSGDRSIRLGEWAGA